jgi:GT2 family glycosyltransferase
VLQRLICRNRKNTTDINQIHHSNHQVAVVSGACVFFRRDKFVSKQLFLDEDFFLYSEDTEWSFRVHRAGFTNYFCGETQIRHVNGASSTPDSNRDKQLYVSELLYFYKTLSPWVFYFYVCALRFNFILNNVLLRRKRMGEELIKLKEEQALFSSYLRLIKRHFKRTVNSCKHPLTYGKKDY